MEKVFDKMKETEQKIREVEGMYLDFDLQGLAKKIGRPLVIANYICDKNDVIARKGESGEFQVAPELKNASDWRLFQELTAQADAIITGAGYLKRYMALGERSQNVIDQFSEGGQFASLGEWRIKNGLKMNPDIVVVSRSLDFEIPAAAFADGRKVMIFTTFDSSASEKAKGYEKSGAVVIPAGKDGVDGKVMIDYLTSSEDYKVIKMTTGPRVLQILLSAGMLDELFITRVDKEIKADASDVQTVLRDGKVKDLPGFAYQEIFHQDGVTASDGQIISQSFGVYKKDSISDF